MGTLADPVIWNNLKIEYVGQLSFDHALDSEARNALIKITNIGSQSVNDLVFQVAIEGVGDYPKVTGDGGFAVFPNGGNIDLAPGESFIAKNWLSGIYESRFNNVPPAAGETKVYNFDFIIATDNDQLQASNPTADASKAVKLSQAISFSNTNYDSGFSGPQTIAGTINNVAAGNNVKVEISTPYSKWYTVNTQFDTDASQFTVNVPQRDDWLVRISGTDKVTQIVQAADMADDFSLTLQQASSSLEYGYTVAKTHDSDTGFWRGIVSEEESTFVLIPGQENWANQGSDSANIAIRQASAIKKYNFSGELQWQYQTGWECWGGDMTADGSKVAFLINPTAYANYRPEWKLGLLDGATGELLWSVSNNETYLEGLECAINADGSLVAAGSGSRIAVFSGDNGSLVWSHQSGTYGQVRNMVFQDGYLYAGTGDSYLYKLNATTGEQVWKAYIGGWPFVNGLNISPNGELIATGTKSKDTTVINASTGEVLWSRETGSLDAVFSPNSQYVANFYGDIFNALTGELVGQTGRYGTVHFSSDSQYLLQPDRSRINISDLTGYELNESRDTSDTEHGNGEQAQWTYLSTDGSTIIVASRDMDTPGERGVTIWQKTALATTVDDSNSNTTDPVVTPVDGDATSEEPAPADETASDPVADHTQKNTFVDNLSDQIIDGGADIDTMVYQDTLASYALNVQVGTATVVVTSPDGSDNLTNIERFRFSDKSLAIDIDGATSAGGIYRLYKATFNREPDHGGLGYWIDQADKGNKDAVRMAEDFSWSQEFQDLYNITTTDNYGTGTDVSALVIGFYNNVLGRAPDQGGLDYYTGVIRSQEKTVGRVLAEISDSPENYNNTLSAVENGIQYDLWMG